MPWLSPQLMTLFAVIISGRTRSMGIPQSNAAAKLRSETVSRVHMARNRLEVGCKVGLGRLGV